MDPLRRWARASIHSLYTRWRHDRRARRSRALIAEYLSAHRPAKIHLGAGSAVIDGWMNTDFDPQSPGVEFLDAAGPYPVPDNSVGYLFSEHMFEHLDLAQQRRMLGESVRVLQPGGVLRTATPNFDVIVGLHDSNSAFVKNYREWSARTFYPEHHAAVGGVTTEPVFVINNYFSSWGHRFIHNPVSMRALLQHAGFREIRQVALQESGHAELRGLERHGTVIPVEYNAMETMVFEATK